MVIPSNGSMTSGEICEIRERGCVSTAGCCPITELCLQFQTRLHVEPVAGLRRSKQVEGGRKFRWIKGCTQDSELKISGCQAVYGKLCKSGIKGYNLHNYPIP